VLVAGTQQNLSNLYSLDIYGFTRVGSDHSRLSQARLIPTSKVAWGNLFCHTLRSEYPALYANIRLGYLYLPTKNCSDLSSSSIKEKKRLYKFDTRAQSLPPHFPLLEKNTELVTILALAQNFVKAVSPIIPLKFPSPPFTNVHKER